MSRKQYCLSVLILASSILLCSGNVFAGERAAQEDSAILTSVSAKALIDRYCVTCHNDRTRTAGLTLSSLSLSEVGSHPDHWEKVVRKLRGGVMPPVGRPRPDESQYDSLISFLENSLDQAWRSDPNAGRIETFHRLNRAEYGNAVRDLFDLDIEVDEFLPADDASYGFDNIAGVLRMSQSLMERYLAAARTISRRVVGAAPPAVDSAIYRVQEDMQQHQRLEELPFGTRGGILVDHYFPQTALYDIRVEVNNDTRLRNIHEMEVSVDGVSEPLFEMGRPKETDPETPVPTSNTTAVMYATDGSYNVRVHVEGGSRKVGVTFLKQPTGLVERVREVFENPTISNNIGVGGRMPRVSTVTIAGPYEAEGPGNTRSRQKVFTCSPVAVSDEESCARTILATLVRKAYRGYDKESDVDLLMGFFRTGRVSGESFDSGIELALRRLLVSPEFLYRIEIEPPIASAREKVYQLEDHALASRLSFFLWSSIPDDELLDLADSGELSNSDVLKQQVRRMLDDPRASALIKNFTGQWLQLRNLETVVRPGDPYSRTFDESLRRGFLKETELFVESILREDRSLIEILTADYTFLNERVARHYGFMDVQGSHFRRVTLPADSPRRGLLGHGSVLTLTSHAIRTSPVNRGKWILVNVLGTPPPDPPPNIPALDDRKTQAKVSTLRERMSQHRANPACASCHNIIDPAGFALENFDAVGRWRVYDESYNLIDATGVLPDGTRFDGVAELTSALVRRPERFVTTVAEKMLTYALGRGLEYYDMPVLRSIVNKTAPDYSFASVITEIVQSYPFLNRQRDDSSGLQAVSTVSEDPRSQVGSLTVQ